MVSSLFTIFYSRKYSSILCIIKQIENRHSLLSNSVYPYVLSPTTTEKKEIDQYADHDYLCVVRFQERLFSFLYFRTFSKLATLINLVGKKDIEEPPPSLPFPRLCRRPLGMVTLKVLIQRKAISILKLG